MLLQIAGKAQVICFLLCRRFKPLPALANLKYKAFREGSFGGYRPEKRDLAGQGSRMPGLHFRQIIPNWKPDAGLRTAPSRMRRFRIRARKWRA